MNEYMGHMPSMEEHQALEKQVWCTYMYMAHLLGTAWKYMHMHINMHIEYLHVHLHAD